jgi:hypothetical protein
VCTKIDSTKLIDKLPEAIRQAFMEYLTKVFEDQVKIVEIQLQKEQNTFENVQTT